MRRGFLHFLNRFKKKTNGKNVVKSKAVVLFVGLGNPGEKYKSTWHNAGFEVMNLLSKKFEKKFKKKYESRVFDVVYSGRRIFFQKPMTYVNLSGKAIRALLSGQKLLGGQVVVIYDDVDLPKGQIRIRPRGGSGGHNGVKSLIDSLGRDDFIRIRIGIGPAPCTTKLEDFVLDKIPRADESCMKQAYRKATQVALMLLDENCEAVMNLFNGNEFDKQSNQEIRK